MVEGVSYSLLRHNDQLEGFTKPECLGGKIDEGNVEVGITLQ